MSSGSHRVTARREAPLVPWPLRAWVAVVVCVLVVGSMGIAFHDEDHGSAFDNKVDGWIHRRNVTLLKLLLKITDPEKVFVLFVVLIAWLAYRRRWRAVVLAVVTPLATVGLVEEVLKPWVNRLPFPPSDHFLAISVFGGDIPRAYPSGHESGIGSFLAVCGLLLLTARIPRSRRLLGLAAVLVVALIASFALVGRYYHYATDTIGSIFVCSGVVLLVAMAIDAISDRLPS